MQEIGQYPLLKPEEEIAYARLVQEMIAIEQSKNELTQQLDREPTMTELANAVEKTEVQIRAALHLGQKAKQKMVTAKLRLVVSVAKKYQNRNLEFLDLIQKGAIGLQRGIEKFDPNRGYKLSTYAYWWISQAITRAIAEQSRTREQCDFVRRLKISAFSCNQNLLLPLILKLTTWRIKLKEHHCQ